MVRSCQRCAGVGRGEADLDSEDRSETIERQGKANEPLAKGGPAKVAPTLTALNRHISSFAATDARKRAGPWK